MLEQKEIVKYFDVSIVPYILLMHVSKEKVVKWAIFETVTDSVFLLSDSLKRNILSTSELPKVIA